ncbi:MAG: thioredoxin family protein, partial [Armatimonadetes bacterium]|nr:thioredoxin family protein [Armatimonadota bacterium]
GSEEIDEAQLVATNWMTYDQALTLAKATKKKVLVDFMADWCHWCHKLDDDVYSTAEFKEAAKDLILCKVDTDHEQEIAKRYNVGGIPDIRILDSEGNEIGKMVGYQPVQQFIQALKKFL